MNHETWHESSSVADTMMTFTLGALAGAAVALLFAPASGRESRAMIADRARRAAERSRRFADEHGATLSDAVEKGREKAMTFASRVGDAVEQGRSSYREALRRGTDMAEDAGRAIDGGVGHTG